MTHDLRELKRAAARLAKAHERTKELEQERDRLIVELAAAFSTRQIAAAIGLTQARVVQITVAQRHHLDEPGGE